MSYKVKMVSNVVKLYAKGKGAGPTQKHKIKAFKRQIWAPPNIHSLVFCPLGVNFINILPDILLYKSIL
jgi:hypothetical protein